MEHLQQVLPGIGKEQMQMEHLPHWVLEPLTQLPLQVPIIFGREILQAVGAH